MLPQEREEVKRLCKLIHEEQETPRFTSLAAELHELLEYSERGFAARRTGTAASHKIQEAGRFESLEDQSRLFRHQHQSAMLY